MLSVHKLCSCTFLPVLQAIFRPMVVSPTGIAEAFLKLLLYFWKGSLCCFSRPVEQTQILTKSIVQYNYERRYKVGA